MTAPVGIAVHLIAEAFALGSQDAELIFSARHTYLWVIVILSLLGMASLAIGIPARRRRQIVAEIIDGLPGHGNSTHFAFISFLTQFSFFVLTESLEGAPLSSGNVAIALGAAFIASCIGAVAITFGRRRLLEFAIAFVAFLGRRSTAASLQRDYRDQHLVSFSLARIDVCCFCRPPPMFRSSQPIAAR
jgi:hypothetical protein